MTPFANRSREIAVLAAVFRNFSWIAARIWFSKALGGIAVAVLLVLAVAAPGDALSAGQGVEAAPGLGATEFRYNSIAIAQPGNDSTVFDNSGNLRVKIDLSPALRSESGDKFSLLLDGGAVSRSTNAEIMLTGIARGTHTLQAEVVDSGGTAVLTSPIVTFHMWQASKLFPNRPR